MAGESAAPLKTMKPKHKFLVGIDSDGCAFDTMEIKHKECFIPNIIKHWGLQAVSKYAREAGEFVNLYSKWRGINRWPALVKVFDLLREREEVRRRGVKIPEATAIRAFIDSGFPLSNSSLKREIERTTDPELAKALAWSEAVNASIEDTVFGVPPFPYMRESLEKLCARADLIVVSQTPTEALAREWREHGIDKYVRVIAGQEMGTKTEHLRYAMEGRYDKANVLMIGDAPGDLAAAEPNGALFFPVCPGDEEESWKRFLEEGADRFLGGTFAGDYQKRLIQEFDRYLPEVPPWKR
ncbi:MAG: HAD hydrolase-like protein [Planctomycetota bacterium]